MRYRCTECGSEIEAAPGQQACAKCGIHVADHPRFGECFTELVTLHYDPPTKVARIGHNKAACNGKPIGHAVRATGDPAVVNCAACRATDAWKANYRGEPTTPLHLDEPAAEVLPAVPGAEGGETAPTVHGVQIDKAGCC